MKDALRRFLIAALVATGIGTLAYVAATSLRSSTLERASRIQGTTPRAVLERASATRAQARPRARIGHFEIARLGLRAALVEGIDDRALLEGIGHVPGTAFPGERGNAGLAGHRDTHLARLKRVQNGDSIRVDTADGSFVYVVDSTFVVAPERVDLLDPTATPMLTVVTCYPFHWIGPAPKRFIVRAHPVSAAPPMVADRRRD